MSELFKNLPGDDNTKTEESKAVTKTETKKVAAAPEEASPSGSSEAETDNAPQMPDELTMLKERARLMGINFSNNIGLETLKAKIEEHKNKSSETASKKEGASEEVTSRANKKRKASTLRDYLRREKMKLVRLRITNLDPKKKDLPGEILTVANEHLGTVRKFVPYGEATDNGYHVPQCLYEFMRDRKFIQIKTRKDRRGNTIVEHQWVREYALEVLPQLTEAELAKLAAAQQAAGGID